MLACQLYVFYKFSELYTRIINFTWVVNPIIITAKQPKQSTQTSPSFRVQNYKANAI